MSVSHLFISVSSRESAEGQSTQISYRSDPAAEQRREQSREVEVHFISTIFLANFSNVIRV